MEGKGSANLGANGRRPLEMRRRDTGECPWRNGRRPYNREPQTNPARLMAQWPLLLPRVVDPNGGRGTNRNRAGRHRRRLQQRREEDQQGCHARQHVFKVARHPMLH